MTPHSFFCWSTQPRRSVREADCVGRIDRDGLAQGESFLASDDGHVVDGVDSVSLSQMEAQVRLITFGIASARSNRDVACADDDDCRRTGLLQQLDQGFERAIATVLVKAVLA